jgi:hypothetical protein
MICRSNQHKRFHCPHSFYNQNNRNIKNFDNKAQINNRTPEEGENKNKDTSCHYLNRSPQISIKLNKKETISALIHSGSTLSLLNEETALKNGI